MCQTLGWINAKVYKTFHKALEETEMQAGLSVLEEMDETPFNDELQSDSMKDKIQPTKESEGVFLSNLW